MKDRSGAILLLLGGLLLRGTIAFWLPPGFDEAYYYLYTQHLDWSYFDHPVLVAFTTGLGVWLSGQVSQFTIRLGPLLLYTGSLVLLYLSSVRLFSKQAALLTLAIASLIPIFLLGFGVFTLPDSPLIFFWTATLYVASLEFFTPPELDKPDSYQPSFRLAIVGLLVGLACLGKYHGVVLGVGLVGFCLTTPRYRSALFSHWTGLGVGLFLVAIAPILIWNSQHDWVSLRYQSGRAIPERGYNLLDLLVTFGAGVAYLFPGFGLPLWWVSLRQLWAAVQKQPKEFSLRLKIQFILWISLPLMLGFTLMGGYRPILPTWAVPGFWGATLLFGYQTSLWQQAFPKRVKRWLWGSSLAIVTLLLLLLSHAAAGTLQQSGRYALLGGLIPADSDASVQLIDIQQLRRGLVANPAISTALAETDFIFTNELFLAGQVGMAIAPLTTKPITCLDQDLRGFAFWSTATEWVGRDGLYFASAQRSPNTLKQYQTYFEQIEKVAEVPLQRGGIVVDTIQVYRSSHLLKPYPRPYGLP